MSEKPDKPKSWRDVIKVHPAADLFPLMTHDELKAMGEDIKANGMRIPIVLWAAGDSEGPTMGSDPPNAEYQLLDGRNRLDAAEAVGLTIVVYKRGTISIEGTDAPGRGSETEHLYEFKVSYGVPNGMKRRERWVDPWDYVLSANMHRRHLTAEQKIAIVEKVTKANPKWSARRVAKAVGVSPTTAAKKRRDLEDKGDVSTVDTLTDTKGRKQPARKAPPPALVKAAADRAEERSKAQRDADADIDPTTLPKTWKQKYEALARRLQREFDLKLERRVSEQCRSWLNVIGLPSYEKTLAELAWSITSRKGLMDRLTYRKILACLHPDRAMHPARFDDPGLKKNYEEAFHLFTKLEKRMLDEKESPTQFRPMPKTLAEFMAMKAKVEAERKAKRAAKSAAEPPRPPIDDPDNPEELRRTSTPAST